MKDFTAVWKHACREKQTHLWVAIGSFFSLLFVVGVTAMINPPMVPKVWGILEPVIGITILIVAILVWFGETAQDYESSLPKRLNVSFIYDNKKIMRCENAYLAGEGDIRAWGQQLGAQMADDRNLKFKFFKQTPGKICHDCDKDTETVKLYELEIILGELPAALKTKDGCLTRKYNHSDGDFTEESLP